MKTTREIMLSNMDITKATGQWIEEAMEEYAALCCEEQAENHRKEVALKLDLQRKEIMVINESEMVAFAEELKEVTTSEAKKLVKLFREGVK